MFYASYLTKSYVKRSAQLISDIADAAAIPEPFYNNGGFVWMFRDGSSLVMTGRELPKCQIEYFSAASFDPEGNEIQRLYFDAELANQPAL